MRNWKAILSSLIFLAAVSRLTLTGQDSRSGDHEPQIDVENYAVDAELMPSSQKLKAKASIRFAALEDVTSVVFGFNANLQLEKVYLADHPPGATAVAAPLPPEVSDSKVPYLTRNPKKKSADPKSPVNANIV